MPYFVIYQKCINFASGIHPPIYFPAHVPTFKKNTCTRFSPIENTFFAILKSRRVLLNIKFPISKHSLLEIHNSAVNETL